MTIFSARNGSSGGNGGFLPAGVGAFMRRRLHEVLGGVLLAVAFFMAGALITYSPGDPSLNSAAHADARNMLGISGAYVADLLLQVFGLVSAVPVLVVAVWGIQIIRKRAPKIPAVRLALLMLGLLLLSMALSAVPGFKGWPLAVPLGGVAGAVVLERSLDVINHLVGLLGGDWRVEGWMLSLVALVPGVVALVTVLGLSRGEWMTIGRTIGRTGARLWTWARYWSGRARRSISDMFLGAEQRPAYAGDATKGAGRQRKKPNEEGAGTVIERQPSPRVIEKKPKPKTGRKAVAKRQAKFDLIPGDEFELPPHELLEAPPQGQGSAHVNKDSLEQNAKLLESVLDDFGVRGEIRKVRPGPVVTLYELEPAPGTKTSRVIGLSDDIARSMSAVSVRVAVVPGRNVIGIELPNLERELTQVFEDKK